ncbi:MAG: hypothetical protein A2822_04385 [Candidatus Staskawiczbacteria bacterium RIFCSPHIGHO2_01_FULL_41_41]|uniref:Uncharacterized protein n=1 Tax=Candidatus Staskawiczbacteria bacterium RIFCSPHIGHO2_01_FULL_41_41 TaxID=1802203 RepID=A0A1G2HSI4_9BACT|nr:MAG: hypothetical protein A2822_04385 [Candidatus Staskawiczbacteria bacterium RIFCSPHIGHO2_01_FULL_41_41]OGZ74633.1 MAG: hypothetical protein A3A12_00605 [Candidatus Staskawiczbacteria bacterium RIFCSPLOWO2_01_FULL_43_17b]
MINIKPKNIFAVVAVVLVVFMLLPGAANISADTSGPNSPSTTADDSGVGIAPWADHANITASDNSPASAIIPAVDTITHYLKATNFGFSIPAGAIIDGIVVEWERRDADLGGANTKDNAVRIVKGGTIGSTDKASVSTWPASDAYATYGGSSDLWGETWTVDDINSSTFGAALSARNVTTTSSASPYVDHVRVTVYYTPGITIGGTVYTDEGTTNIGANKTVAVSVNGAAAAGTDDTDASGVYSITGITVVAGDVLTLYVDDETEKGVTVTVGTGSDMTNIHIFQNYLITRCDNSCSLSNANINTANNNGDTDIDAIYTGTTTITTAEGKSLYIPASHTFAPANPVSVGGSWTDVGTFSPGTSTVTFSATATGKTITTTGSSFNNLTFDGVGGGWAFQDNSTITATLTVTNGSLDANGTDITVANVSSSNANTRTIALGTGTWTLNGTDTVWTTATTTGLTLTESTSTIAITDTSSTSKTFAGGGKTYYNISITASGSGAVIFTGANTFNNFTINNPKTITFPASTTTTISGTFSCSGSSGNVITINSSSDGVAATLSKASGIVACNYLSLQDSAATGGATWRAGSNSTDVSGNTGWTFGTVAPPAPSGFNPATGSTIKTATPNITFTLDEDGDCKASTTNASYSAMSGTDCIGDGSSAGACSMASLGSNGSKTIYFACQDVDGNQDAADTTHSVTYTLSTSDSAAATMTLKGAGVFKGSGAVK